MLKKKYKFFLKFAYIKKKTNNLFGWKVLNSHLFFKLKAKPTDDKRLSAAKSILSEFEKNSRIK